jgi:hypothetical protein
VCSDEESYAGRNERAIVDWRHLATEANVPADWLLNVLEAQVLHRLDPKGRYHVRFEPSNVWIEPTFGQEPVEFG